MRLWLRSRLRRGIGSVAVGLVSLEPAAAFARAVPAESELEYRQLRRALRRHLFDVGEFVELERSEAARDALHMATAIESELEVT